MSRSAKLYPTRIYRTQHDPVIENESNMYTGVDSDTYASVTTNTSYTDALFLGGFDFSSIPTKAIVSSFSIKMRLASMGSGVQSNGSEWLYNGKRVITVSNRSTVYIYSTPMVSTIDATPLTFEDLRSYGDDFNISVRTTPNGVMYVYGVEIDVEYDLPKNKVVYFGETLIDLTADTVTAERLTKGFTAHDASGALITGVATEGSTYQDEDDCVVLSEDESSSPQGNISITANGTYDVAQYAGASVEVPIGMSETDLSNFIQRSTTFTDIDWPDGMTRIGIYAFAGCTKFAPSSLPSSIKIIDSDAFNSCTNLALTELPSGITSIGSEAFYQCNKLALTSLPSGINSVKNRTFYCCSKLALTSLPSGVTSIGDYAFYGCSELALTSLPSGVAGGIGSYAFYACSKLALTSIPDGVTSIGSSAFLDCHSLAITELPSALKTINNSAFVRCNNITSLSCEGAITTLGASSFLGDSNYPMSLRSVSFPNMALTSGIATVFGTTTAANACQLLEFCDIGSTTGVGSNAFANCYALETLVLRKTASVCALGSTSAFLNTPMRGYNDKTGKVYVPSALIESYKTANNWKTLYDAGTVEFLAIEGSEYER